MSINLKNFRRLSARRAFLLFAVCAVAAVAVVSPFVAASCRTAQPQRSPQEVAAAVERLRALTGTNVLPAESVVASIETDYADTRAGALARLLHARIKLASNDFAGAASLLESKDIAEHTALGDYALLLRAQALEKANRAAEARAAYEQLTRDYPNSLRARTATLRAAEMLAQAGQSAGIPAYVKSLSERDDAAALLLAAKAHEQQGDTTRALAAYRRIYFFTPATAESSEAADSIERLNSTTAPATAEEASTRADKLFEAKRYEVAFDAYTDALARFPAAASPQSQLRRVAAAANARRTVDAVAALNSIPTSSGDARAEALHHVVLAHARAKAWDAARTTLEEMRRTHAQSPWTMRALAAAAQLARDAKNLADANYFSRAAVASFPGRPEVAGAQFELAWATHESKNFAESSRLLIEHLAEYADENTDNRGRAGYWAARDSERAGRTVEAHTLYRAMLQRYDANWYGQLAKQRLDTMNRNGSARTPSSFAPDPMVARAVANLEPVTIAEETAGSDADERIAKADELNAVGLDEWAHAEVDDVLKSAPSSPRLNLAKARLFRARGANLEAFNVLRRSFPDYSQMKPEELTREEWDVFYPLAHWEIIVQEARARNLDPHTVAGLIRQESVFNTRAVSPARAYGLMQLLVPTGRLVAQRYGVGRSVTVESLFEPRLNIQLGTGYMRDQFDKFGRIEYVAAAYNAGPGRAVTWRASLPLEIDEWAEAIPFKETRGYVQGVVRNSLQYRRLYDEQGRFRPEVGTRATRTAAATREGDAPPAANNNGVRSRRVTGNEREEE